MMGASIEATLELWASSLRDVKKRIRPLFAQEAERVYQNMALLALDLLARIVPVPVDAGPPFSALLTLWLSMIAAVGLASRPAFSRHWT